MAFYQNDVFPVKIITGGQTGADRGALDAAIILGVEHGGWCPKNRLAEDGSIPENYNLSETLGPGFIERTKLNVRDSDATVIFTKPPFSRGSKLTIRTCIALEKPHLILSGFPNTGRDTVALFEFLKRHPKSLLNVAGSRESKLAGIADHVYNVFIELMSLTEKPLRNHPAR